MNLSQPQLPSSQSFSDLEKENYILRLKLERAEDIIRSLQNEERGRSEQYQAEESLRLSEARLENELADTKLLQSISAHLIHEEHVDTLYTKIVEAALAIMQSDFATIQMYYPGPGTIGHLRLLAASGLSQEGIDFWDRVDAQAGTLCAVAMQTGNRVMSADMLTCEYVVNTPDHEMFVRANVRAAQSTPLFSRNGQLLGMISTHWTRNHTPSERDLNLLDILARQAADLIERKINEDALRQSQISLREADRRKDDFLATLAHELRNPLAPINNALHILIGDPANPKSQEMLAMMDRQVAHLVRLIDDLLDVSRIRNGKIDLRRKTISFQEALLDALEASRPLIEKNSHTLILDAPEDPIWVNADATRLAQIIGNILNNAAKYTDAGGNIEVRLQVNGEYASVSISDNGVGIPSHMLPSIFDLFMQVDCNTHQSKGGLGIGLALVKQLVDLHDGKIEVESTGINSGSTFTIHLPITCCLDENLGKDHVVEISKADSRDDAELRVLVVDDNTASAETMGSILEMHGHKVQLAFNGDEALKLAQEFRPDAILLDIDLPDMNGYQVCRELRNNSLTKSAVVIAQTGYGQDSDRQLTRAAGFDHHFVKPLDIKSLCDLLSNATQSSSIA